MQLKHASIQIQTATADPAYLGDTVPEDSTGHGSYCVLGTCEYTMLSEHAESLKVGAQKDGAFRLGCSPSLQIPTNRTGNKGPLNEFTSSHGVAGCGGSHEIPIAWGQAVGRHISRWSTAVLLHVLQRRVDLVIWLPLLGSPTWTIRIRRIEDVFLFELHRHTRVIASLSCQLPKTRKNFGIDSSDLEDSFGRDTGLGQSKRLNANSSRVLAHFENLGRLRRVIVGLI